MALSLLFSKAKKFPWVKVLTVFFIVSLVITVVAVLRQAGKNVSEDSLDATDDSFVDKVFGNRNLVSCDKTGILYEAVDQGKFQFEYGESFVDLFISVVPKALWANKPITALEVRIQALFTGPLGDSGSVPPGLVAEGYLEFGFAGIIVLLFCYGYFMGYTYNVYNNSIPSTSLLLYFFVCYQLAFNMVGFTLASGTVQFLRDFVPLYFALKILK
jgi:oligosaccharide repeat unit polymerase